MIRLLDEYLPLKYVKINAQDKPWVTSYYLDLIAKRQIALMKDDKANIRYYRNKVKRTGQTLRSDFLKSSLEGVKRGDKKWWNITKQLSGLKMNDNSLQSMAILLPMEIWVSWLTK